MSGQDISASFTVGSAASGQWQLFVQDFAPGDIGTVKSFALHITSSM